MKIIRVTMMIEFPEDRLTVEERERLPKEFGQMKQEMMADAPEGTTIGLGIEHVERP